MGRGREQIQLLYFELLILLPCLTKTQPAPIPSPEQENTVKLPEPRYDSDVSLEQSLLQRRSIRTYTGEPLTLQEVSQLLWAAQGITDPTCHSERSEESRDPSLRSG